MTVIVNDGYGAHVSASAYLASDLSDPPAVATGPAPLSVLWKAVGVVVFGSPWYSEMDHAQLIVDFNGLHVDTGVVPFVGAGGPPAALTVAEPATVLAVADTFPMVAHFMVWSGGFKVVDRTATESVVLTSIPGPFWPPFKLNAAPVGQQVTFE